MERRDDSNDAQQTILGVVALVVSAVALVGTIAQVLQQYYSSAAGYTNCGERVMGKWHESKKRRFRPYELRFEVQFETPVIFVSPPSNDKGPVQGAPIYFLDGTKQSLYDTRTLLPTEDRKKRDELVYGPKQVHTADNERATWVMLLSELQSMEKESQDWQKSQYNRGPPTSQPQAQFNQHTLAVALQSKKRSWDTMPSNVKKPYATTAMCHLLEIAAMLGLHWKEFSRSTDRYRAEGNGYILTGTKVDDLGLMFTFQIYGKSRFHENRVIPVDEVKELCCGYISTIFRKDMDGRRLELTEEEPQDLSILQIGSPNDLAEAMVLIGCNTNTANYFRSNKTKHGHLFPCKWSPILSEYPYFKRLTVRSGAFELVGMLSKSLHIANTCFRMLPNPTPYHWDKKFFSLRKLLQEYKKQVQDDDITPQTGQVRRLARLAEKVESELQSGPQDFSILLLNALHSAIDECDVFLREGISRELITMVLREHFQEVLRMVNEPDPADAPTTGTAADGGGGGQGPQSASANGSPVPPGAGGTPLQGQNSRPARFDDLNSAAPEEKQAVFMDIYFSAVLPRVVRQAVEAFRRRKTTRYAPSHHGRDTSTGSTHTAVATPVPSPGARPHVTAGGPHETQGHGSGQMLNVGLHIQIEDSDADDPNRVRADSDNSGIGGHESSGHRPQRRTDTETLSTQANNIWCTLVFRMLCWLLLHDFDKKDVQISKSELLGSRLPVYIA